MDQAPKQSSSNLTLRHGGLICLLSTLAGLAALSMLPIGMFLSTRSHYWNIAFYIHISLLLCATVLSLALLTRIVAHCRWKPYLCVACIALFIVAILLASSTPVVSRDALIHHLVVPKWWIQEEAIRRISWHEWSHYPMLINMGYAGLIGIGLEALCPLYHFCYLLLLCGVASWFTYYKTRDVELSFLAYLITLTLPICVRLASSPLVDLGLALYTAIALCAMVYWAERNQQFRYILLAGVALGLACGCKYNGFLSAGLISLLFLTYSTRSGISVTQAVAAFIFSGTIAFVIASPWLMKNVIWTGSNPVYPMFRGVLNPGEIIPGGPSIKPIEKLQLLYNEGIFDIIVMPLKMIMLGEDDNPRLYDGRLSPILFLCIFPLFFIRRTPWVIFYYLYLLSYFYLAISLSSARVRYMAPLLFPIIILTVVGLQLCGSFFKGKFRYQLYSLIAFTHLCFSLIYVHDLLDKQKVVPFLSNEISSEEYLAASIPEYPMIQYINQHSPSEDFTYLLFTGNKFYYYQKPVLSGGYFSGNQIIYWIKNSHDAQTLAQSFLQRGIRQLLVHTARTTEAFQHSLPEDKLPLWNEFSSQHLSLEHNARGFSLWSIHEQAPPVEEASKEWVMEADEASADALKGDLDLSESTEAANDNQ